MNIKTENDTNYRIINQAFFDNLVRYKPHFSEQIQIVISENHIKRGRRLYKKLK